MLLCGQNENIIERFSCNDRIKIKYNLLRQYFDKDLYNIRFSEEEMSSYDNHELLQKFNSSKFFLTKSGKFYTRRHSKNACFHDNQENAGWYYDIHDKGHSGKRFSNRLVWE